MATQTIHFSDEKQFHEQHDEVCDCSQFVQNGDHASCPDCGACFELEGGFVTGSEENDIYTVNFSG